jgi:hypothetical protein
MDGYRCSAHRLRATDTHVGELIGQHDHRVADTQLGVTYSAVWTGHRHPNFGTEH